MREEERGRIDRSVVVEAPIERLWSAVSTADGLEAWLGGEVELDPRPGRPVLVRWPDRSTSRGLVERVEPPHRFVFRWRRIEGAGLVGLRLGEPTRVEIRLARIDERRTRVEIEERPAPMPLGPVAVAAAPGTGTA
jgi:uncharacterized protein YndB with AHSA1/START domain